LTINDSFKKLLLAGSSCGIKRKYVFSIEIVVDLAFPKIALLPKMMIDGSI
jgi:hypothetical protein